MCAREWGASVCVCDREWENYLSVCVRAYNSSGMCMYVFELQQLLLLSRYTSHVLRTSLCALLLYVNPNPWPGTHTYTHSHTWAMAAAAGQVAEDRRLFDYSGSSSSSLSFFLPGLHSLFAWNICSSFCYFFLFYLTSLCCVLLSTFGDADRNASVPHSLLIGISAIRSRQNLFFTLSIFSIRM